MDDVVLEKIEEIGKKLDVLMKFLEVVFLTREECALLKEVDEVVKERRFGELKSIDEA